MTLSCFTKKNKNGAKYVVCPDKWSKRGGGGGRRGAKRSGPKKSRTKAATFKPRRSGRKTRLPARYRS